jgi:hypothetical protein
MYTAKATTVIVTLDIFRWRELFVESRTYSISSRAPPSHSFYILNTLSIHKALLYTLVTCRVTIFN